MFFLFVQDKTQIQQDYLNKCFAVDEVKCFEINIKKNLEDINLS